MVNGIVRKDGGLAVQFATPTGGEQEDPADVVLIATGRWPYTESLGLESVGLQLERRAIPVNERMQTRSPGIYAIGDCVPGLQLAHRGLQQGIFVAEEFAGLDPPPIDEAGIPRVTYCDPEVASVGLDEAAARV